MGSVWDTSICNTYLRYNICILYENIFQKCILYLALRFPQNISVSWHIFHRVFCIWYLFFKISYPSLVILGLLNIINIGPPELSKERKPLRKRTWMLFLLLFLSMLLFSCLVGARLAEILCILSFEVYCPFYFPFFGQTWKFPELQSTSNKL